MNQNIPPGGAEALALQRFALVTKVQDLLHQRIPLRTFLHALRLTRDEEHDQAFRRVIPFEFCRYQIRIRNAGVATKRLHAIEFPTAIHFFGFG